MRFTVDIPELSVEQWTWGEYDHLSPVVRKQIEAIEELYYSDEVEWTWEDVEDHCPIRREKNSLIEEYLAGGLRLSPMLSRCTTSLRIQAVARNIEGDWRDNKRDEYYAEHGNETRILIVRPEEVDDLITSETNRDYFRDEIWIDTLDEDPIPYLILDIEELKNLREEIEDSTRRMRLFDSARRMATPGFIDAVLDSDSSNSRNWVVEDDEDEGIVFEGLGSLFSPGED